MIMMTVNMMMMMIMMGMMMPSDSDTLVRISGGNLRKTHNKLVNNLTLDGNLG